MSKLHLRRFRTLTLLAVMALLLSLSGGLVKASQTPAGLDAPVDNAYAICTATNASIVTCNLKVVANQSSLDLTTDILPLAQQVNSAITADTTMWLQAWGGQGGKGGDSIATAGNGGAGGFAQTITTINDYQATYGMTTLYYYFGGCCKNEAADWSNGGGGASSIVAAEFANLSASNVLLVAGGGGGGNAAVGTASGQGGGYGGYAIASTSNATYGAGQSLSGNNGVAHGGSYSGPGKGSPSINPSGIYGAGGDGFGGWGGGSVSGELDTRTFWVNETPGVGDFGHGLNSGGSPGSPSGGGYGGGGMNACGGSTNSHHNCAGPGGGSYAAGLTQYDWYAPQSYQPGSLNSHINIVFNLRPASFAYDTPTSYPFGLANPGNITNAAPAFADLRNTGVPDAVVGDAAGTLWHYPSSAGPSYGAAQKNALGLSNILSFTDASIAFADVDQDGDPDAFVGHKEGGISYYEYDIVRQELQYKAPVLNPFGITTTGANIALAFVNLNYDPPATASLPDGPSLFYGNAEGDLYYLPYSIINGEPHYGAPVKNPFGITTTGTNIRPAFANLVSGSNYPGNVTDGPSLFYGNAEGDLYYLPFEIDRNEPQYGVPVKNPFGITPTGTNIEPTFVNLGNSLANLPDGPSLFYGNAAGDLYYQPYNLVRDELQYGPPVQNPFGIIPTGTNIAPAFVNLDSNTKDNPANLPYGPSFFYGNAAGDLYYQPYNVVRDGLQYGAPVKNPFSMTNSASYQGAAPTFVDIDGDGLLDAFVGDNVGQIWYYQNTGTATSPTFAAALSNPFGIAFPEISFAGGSGQASNVVPAFADIDGDGDQDLFAGVELIGIFQAEDTGPIVYFENTGTAQEPAFAAPQTNPFGILQLPPGTPSAAPTFVDIDGDGDQDLFIGDGNGNVHFQINIGAKSSPAFDRAVTNPDGIAKKASGNAKPIAIDITGDGLIDLFVGASGGDLWYYQNAGPLTGSPGLAEPVPPFDATPAIEVSLDHLATQQVTAVVYGSETFDASQVNQDIIAFEDWSGNRLATVVKSFWSSATGDLNGDGYLDRTLTFHTDDPAAVLHEANDGKELCVQGVTLDGVEFRGCAFVE